MWFAGIGAAASVALVFAYYIPGLASHELGEVIVLLAIPAAALAFPFLLLALVLRVKVVWIVSGSLMFFLLAGAAIDVFEGVEDEPSLLAFAGTFFFNLFNVLVAAIVDVAIRGGRKAHRALSSTRSSDERSGDPEP